MGILFNLLIAVIVFLLAQWLIAFTGIPSPLNLLLAIAVAIAAFFGTSRTSSGWRW